MTKTKQKTRLQPLGNRVLVKRLEAEQEVKGGIILPDSAQKKKEIAEVIALGTGNKTSEGKEIPFPVKEGNRILIEKYSGQEVKFEEEEFVILRADEIIAIVE